MLHVFLQISSFMHEEANIFEKYDVDSYLGSFGLVVDRSYRGLGLGQRLLEAR